MLNKNDPLISAVQQVMKNNEIEREVTKLVNEAFGVQDRKALPHERQAEWNHVYQLALSEAKIDHPNKQVLDVHEPKEDELTPEDFAELRRRRAAKMAKKKPVAEEMKDPNERDVTSPSSAGIKAPNYAKGTPDYAKPTTQTVNRGEKTSLPPGTLKKHMKEENLEEKEMSDDQKAKREEIVKSMKKKKSDFKERYGKNAENVMYGTATKMAMSESIRNIIAERYAGQQGAGGVKPVRPRSFLPRPNVPLKGSPLDQTQGAKPEVSRDYRLNKMRQSPPALDASQKTVAQSQAPMKQAQNRQDLAKSVQAGRAGTNTALDRAGAASRSIGTTGNPMGDYNPGQEDSTPTSPKSQAQLNTSPSVSADKPKEVVARKKAEPIKVSDTEVMNDPKFKQARKSVGGEAGARNIQVGQNVKGLGRFNQGDTIMSRVRTDIAARKNVGRES